MKVAFGTDERSAMTDEVERHITSSGHEIVFAVRDESWPRAGRSVGSAVADGSADVGVVMCWTGTGVSIAANKVSGVRAALCADAQTATGARRWNDANVVAMGMRHTTAAVAVEICDAFFGTDVDPDEQRIIRDVEAE